MNRARFTWIFLGVVTFVQAWFVFRDNSGLPFDVDLQHNVFASAISWITGTMYPTVHIWPGWDVVEHFRYPPVYHLLLTGFFVFLRDWGWASLVLHGVVFCLTPLNFYLTCRKLYKPFTVETFPAWSLLLLFQHVFLGVYLWQTQTPELISLNLVWLSLNFILSQHLNRAAVAMAIVGLTHPRFLQWASGFWIATLVVVPKERRLKTLLVVALSYLPIIAWIFWAVTKTDNETTVANFPVLATIVREWEIWFVLGLFGAVVSFEKLPRIKAVMLVGGFFFYFLQVFLAPYLSRIPIFDAPLFIREGGAIFFPLLAVLGALTLSQLGNKRIQTISSPLIFILCLSLWIFENRRSESLRGMKASIAPAEAVFLRALELPEQAKVANFSKQPHVSFWCTPLLKRPCLFWRERMDELSGKDVEKFRELQDLANRCVLAPSETCSEELQVYGITHVYIAAGQPTSDDQPPMSAWKGWVDLATRWEWAYYLGDDNGAGRRPLVVELGNSTTKVALR